MFIHVKHNFTTLKTILYSRPLMLSVAIAGVILTANAQAMLPTPSSIVDSGSVVEPSEVTSTRSVDGINVNTNQSEMDAQITNSVQAEQLLSEWREQVQTQQLAQHTTWRRLLYFVDDKPSRFKKDSNESLIDNPNFYLSPNGQQDSAAELDALLVRLANEITTPSKNSVACRFPARVQWLSETLAIDSTRLQMSCPELDDWMTKLAPEQLSIMFAEEYLDNPISAFAHTLLRIDSPASLANPNHIHHAYALNDTVDGNAEDAFAIYAIKSLAGGYNNVIEIDPYPEKLAKYLQEDERDAWTYQLDLTPSEVRQIMRHVWEMKDLDIPYYFTTDNCASEILRLIDVVRPKQHLLSQLPYAVVPFDVIHLLNNEGLLLKTTYTPSDSTVRQAQLNQAKAATTLGYQQTTKKMLTDLKSAETNPASALSADGQRLVTLGIDASDNNPIDRHPLHTAQVGIGQRGDNAYIDVGIRAGFHDTLDRSTGFASFFNLEGLAATLRFYDRNDNTDHDQPERVVLEQATLVRGRSFNPINTAKKGKTWGASLEAIRVNDASTEAGRDHLVGSVGYEQGWSWALGTPTANTGELPPQLCYTFASGTAQAGRGITKGFRVGVGMNVGCRYQINTQLRAQTELQLPYWYHGDSDDSHRKSHYWQPISTFGLQYDIDRKQALRLDATYDWQDRIDDNEDIKLSYRRYF